MQKASVHFRSTISSSPQTSYPVILVTINYSQILTLLNHPSCPCYNNSKNISFTMTNERRVKKDVTPLQRLGSNRTLLDAVQDEPGNANGRKNWQHLKEKLKLCRHNSGSNWTSSVRVPTSDIPLNNNNKPRQTLGVSTSSIGMERASGRFEHTSSLAMRRLNREPNEEDINLNQEDEEEDEDEGSEVGGGGSTSLMALLAETDKEMGIDGLGYMMDLEEEDDDEDEDDEMSEGGEGYNNCCVCMVRHKGAAFIPCGHSFCRLCSRELFAQRGNCPLCNNYILEILDIL